jgi:hypothetical protein
VVQVQDQVLSIKATQSLRHFMDHQQIQQVFMVTQAEMVQPLQAQELQVAAEAVLARQEAMAMRPPQLVALVALAYQIPSLVALQYFMQAAAADMVQQPPAQAVQVVAEMRQTLLAELVAQILVVVVVVELLHPATVVLAMS